VEVPESVRSDPLSGIQGFNPATDILQIQSGQAASFAALDIAASGNGSVIALPPSTGNGQDIYLSNVAPSALHAANFRFV
jgi:hypothetical protein